MAEIKSLANPLIKDLSKLQQKKYREKSGCYLLEGFHLFAEALKAGEKVRYVLATPAAWQTIKEHYQLDLPRDKQIVISRKVAQKLSATKNPQEVFLVLSINKPRDLHLRYGKWVLLDNLADPGNVGTIIRTADAAGFDGVVLSPATCDLYNAKVQRSMQGSQFHLRLLKMDLVQAISQLKVNDIPVYASLLDKKAKKLADFVPQGQVGLIIGNEAHGVRPQISQLADEKLYIPIYGQAESLNAAVAAGIMIYHFS